MNSRSTTLTLLVLIVFLGLWASGRFQKAWGSVFGEVRKK